jgi:hypothetical protein
MDKSPYENNKWLFEYQGADWESYTDKDFSEEWVRNYLQNEKNGNFYCCLFRKETEEAIFVYGNKELLIIEAHFIINGKMKNYVFQTKDKLLSSNVTLNNIPEQGEKMSFPNNEIFNSSDAVMILTRFYKDKDISESVCLLEKSYLF